MTHIYLFTISYFISLIIFLHLRLPAGISAILLGGYLTSLIYLIIKKIRPDKLFISSGGFLWGVFICSIPIASYQSPDLEARQIIFDGYIRSSPEYNERSTTYNVVVDRYIIDERLFIQRFEMQYNVFIPFAEPIRGDLIRGKCRPHRLEDGRIICISREDEPPIIIERRSFNFFNRIDGYREQISRFIYKKYKGSSAAILTALSTGNSGNLTYDTRRIFAQAGTSHILAISGTHIGLIALFLYYIIKLILSPFILLHPFSLKKVSSIILIPILISISFYFGNTESVVRATTMIILYLFSILIERERDILSSLCLAFILITSFSLDSIKDVGFQLSFLSVLGIITFVPSFTKSEDPVNDRFSSLLLNRLKTLFLTSLAASIFTFPFVAYHFGIISIAGIVANILLVPFTGLISLPLIMCGVLTSGISEEIGELFLNGAFVSLEHFYRLNTFFASLPLSNIKFFRPSILEIVLYFILIFILIFRKYIPVRKYIIASFSIILILSTLIMDRIETNSMGPFLLVRRGIVILYDNDNIVHLISDSYSTSNDIRHAVEFLRERRIISVEYTNAGLRNDTYIKDHLYTTKETNKIYKSVNGDILINFLTFNIFVYNDLSMCPPSSVRYVISRRSSEEAIKRLSECGIRADSLLFAGDLKNTGLKESLIKQYGQDASKILICKDEDCEIKITPE